MLKRLSFPGLALISCDGGPAGRFMGAGPAGPGAPPGRRQNGNGRHAPINREGDDGPQDCCVVSPEYPAAPASMTGMLGATAAVTAARRSRFSFQPVIVQAALDAVPVTGAAVPSRRWTEMLRTGGLPPHPCEPARYRMIFSTSAHGMKMAGLCRAARLVGMTPRVMPP